MVQIAATSEVGRLLCQSTYTLEGDESLALTMYRMFGRLDEYFEDGIRFKSTLNACTAAAALVDVLCKILFDDILRIEGSVGRVTEIIEALKSASYSDEEKYMAAVPTYQKLARKHAVRGRIDYNLMQNGRNNV